MRNFNAILVIAYRDFLKFLRDKPRIVGTFIFPIIFIGILGKGSDSSLGSLVGFNLLFFTFTGVLAQTLFQSSASGVISLIEDRENDFSQEIFVSPISRFAILLGKIVGESLVALIQAIGIIIFGYIIGAGLSVSQLAVAIPVMILSCLFGAAFGVFILSNLSTQRAANMIFPFVILPQFFLSGIFTPIRNFPWYLEVLARIAPLTYIVDLMRGVVYFGNPEASKILLNPIWVNLVVISGMFVLFLSLGTFLFVRNERNR